MDPFANIQKKLQELERLNNKVIMEESKFISNSDMNKVGRILPKPTDKEARDDARYRAIKLRQSFDESETPPEELKEVEKSIADKIIKDVFDRIFE